MEVYLDTSIYNRPFDDQAQPKIFLETQAVTVILQMVEAELVELVSSSVLEDKCLELTLKVVNPVDLILEIDDD